VDSSEYTPAESFELLVQRLETAPVKWFYSASMVNPDKMDNPVMSGVLAEVTVDGKRLETLTFSSRTAERPTIVMLHEGLGSVALWKDFPQRIAERTGCAVVVYSRYGYGGSDQLEGNRPVEYLHHEAEVVLPSLLNEVGIEHPVLLGHSDGASIALLYAGKYPDSPRALILEAPHVFVEDLALEGIAKTRTLYQTTDLPSRLARYHRHADTTFWGWNDIWLDPRFRAWNIESYLDPIKCPVLLVQGRDDEYGTIRQLEAIQKRIPSAQLLLLANCGHSPHRDQPEATLESIAQFIAPLMCVG
jgi:pimeloyl-ACP methyl ester carboxylesterase